MPEAKYSSENSGLMHPETYASSESLEDVLGRLEEARKSLQQIERATGSENPAQLEEAVDQTVADLIKDCKEGGCIIAGNVGVLEVSKDDIQYKTASALGSMPASYLDTVLRDADRAGFNLKEITDEIDTATKVERLKVNPEDSQLDTADEDDWDKYWPMETPAEASSNDKYEMTDSERKQRDIKKILYDLGDNTRNPDDYKHLEDFRMRVWGSEDLALDLLNSGHSRLSIIRSANTVFGGLDRIEGEAQNPEQSKQLLLGLLECDGITLDQQDSTLLDEIIEEPVRSAEMIDKIRHAWQKSSESSVDAGVKSRMLLGAFNRYGRVNWQNLDKSYDDYHQEKIDKLGDVFNMVDQDVMDACRLTGGDRDGYGITGVIESVVREEVLFDSEELGFSAKQFIEAYNNSPQEMKKILSEGSANRIGKASDLTIFRRSVEGVSQYIDKLKDIYGSDYQLDDVIMTALNGSIDLQKQALYNDNEYIMSDDPICSLRCATELYDVEPRFDKEIYRKVMSMPGMGAQAAIERLQDPEIIRSLDDEDIKSELKLALPMIAWRGADTGNALDAWRKVDSKLPGLLKVIIASEPTNDDLREPYYDAIRRFMSRQDKNGTPYDSPNTIATFVRDSMSSGLTEKGKTEIDWFTSGDVPVSLLRTVTKARDLLGRDASQISPDEVYQEYRNNPELVEKISHQSLREYIGGDSQLNNRQARKLYQPQNVESAIVTAEAEAEARKGSLRILLNISPESLMQSAIQGGEIKSILDTDTEIEAASTRGAKYILHRSEIEAMAGIRSFGEDKHPIYGSLGFVDRGVPTGAEGYGDVMITFDPSVGDMASRTTFTPEDSFHGTDRLTLKDASTLRVLKNGANLDHTRTSDYIEAQVRGGLKTEDIDMIYVKDTVTYERLRRYLPPELTGKVSLRIEDYDNSREVELLDRYRPEAK